MGMTIDKSISWITESILNMRKSQLCISDKLALKTAIDTMRKYQKIEQIIKDIPYGGDATVRKIQEVVEDGNDK